MFNNLFAILHKEIFKSDLTLTEYIRKNNMTFKDIVALLNKHNKPIVLTEADRDFYLKELKRQKSDEYMFSKPIKEKIDSIDEVVLFHKTNFLPTNDTILSRTNGNSHADVNITINGKEYTTQIAQHRDTVHWSANHEVKAHGNGSWDDMKYIVMTKLVSTDTTKIGSGRVSDVYFRGSVKLPDDSIILCPVNEMDKVKKENPNVIVVGYEGENSHYYGETILFMLGYPVFYFANEWGLDKGDIQNKYSHILEENGINSFSAHFYSEDKKVENDMFIVDYILAIIKIIRDNKEFHEIDTYELLNILNTKVDTYEINYFSNTIWYIFGDNFSCLEWAINEFRNNGIDLTDEQISNYKDLPAAVLNLARGNTPPSLK